MAEGRSYGISIYGGSFAAADAAMIAPFWGQALGDFDTELARLRQLGARDSPRDSP